jgi:hypothetical protein
MWATEKLPNMFLKICIMAGGPSQLVDMAFATFSQQKKM